MHFKLCAGLRCAGARACKSAQYMQPVKLRANCMRAPHLPRCGDHMRCHEVAGAGVDPRGRDCRHARVNGPAQRHLSAHSTLLLFQTPLLLTRCCWQSQFILYSCCKQELPTAGSCVERLSMRTAGAAAWRAACSPRRRTRPCTARRQRCTPPARCTPCAAGRGRPRALGGPHPVSFGIVSDMLAPHV